MQKDNLINLFSFKAISYIVFNISSFTTTGKNQRNKAEIELRKQTAVSKSQGDFFQCEANSTVLFYNWGIYKISCHYGQSYIDQTKRALKQRLKEHETYFKIKI